MPRILRHQRLGALQSPKDEYKQKKRENVSLSNRLLFYSFYNQTEEIDGTKYGCKDSIDTTQ